MSQQEKGLNRNHIRASSFRTQSSFLTPATSRLQPAKPGLFLFEGRCNRKLLSAEVHYDEPPCPLACFMFDGQGLRPANDGPYPAMSKCRNAKPTTPTASRPLPTPSKGPCCRGADLGPFDPRDALLFRNDGHGEAGDNGVPNDSVHV